MIWSKDNYPMENQGLPGSLFSIKIIYTIFNAKLESINGEFVYQVHSGTLQQNSELGIPYGLYNSIGYSNSKINKTYNVIFSLFEKSIKILIT